MNACLGGGLGKGESLKKTGFRRLWLSSLMAAVVPVLSCSQDGLQQELRDAAVGQIELDQIEQNITSYPPLQVFIRDEAVQKTEVKDFGRELVTEYTFDSYGNVERELSWDLNDDTVAPRETVTDYGEFGLFPTLPARILS